jgi:hypothetical protein
LDRDHPAARAGHWPERLAPAEVVDSVFDFAAQLLNAQRELAHSVLGATTAIGESVQKETEKAAGTAKKSTKR